MTQVIDATGFVADSFPADGVIRRGVGVAAGWYGCGNTSLPNRSFPL